MLGYGNNGLSQRLPVEPQESHAKASKRRMRISMKPALLRKHLRSPSGYWLLTKSVNYNPELSTHNPETRTHKILKTSNP